MMSRVASTAEWATRPERGSTPIIRLIVWIALRLGRPIARSLLYPICLYFIVASRVEAGTASRSYLARVLGRPPGFGDVFRHYHAFASTLLDRVFLLGGRHAELEIGITGDDTLRALVARNEGCFLLGAHFGSFEAVRTIGRRLPGHAVSMLMYEDNARKISAVLGALDPRLRENVVALGRSDSMLDVADRLARGEFVGMLADRLLQGEEHVRLPFLGEPAAFPLGPFRIAATLRRPVILMAGIYRGGRSYEVHFQTLADFTGVTREQRQEAMLAAAGRYCERIESLCRQAPYNWFNFYDFWK